MQRKNKVSELATKNDLKLLGNSLRGEVRELKEEIVGEIDEKNEKYKDEILTKLDDISGQLGNLRDENTIGSGQTSQLREDVDNHEKRIKRLKNPPAGGQRQLDPRSL